MFYESTAPSDRLATGGESRHVLVLGGTAFVGRAEVAEALASGHRVNCVVELNFAGVEDARDWADKWVTAHAPTQVATEIADFERQHLDLFTEDYGRGLAQFYVQYDNLVALIDQVNFIDKTSWPSHRPIQFILLAKNLKAFHSAMDRLSKGFYQDAVTLTRGLYDAFLRALHVSCYADNPGGALVDKPPKGVARFVATDIVQTQLRLDWLMKYALMSVYAHANTLEVLVALRHNEDQAGDPERFGLVFEDDVKLVEMAFPFLQFVLLAYLRFVIERMIGSAAPRDQAQFSVAQEAAALLTYGFVSSEKSYWRETVADLDYVFELLEVADAGGDWKAMRDLRPLVESRSPRA